MFDKKRSGKYLNVVKTLMNCLMTKDICHAIEAKQTFSKKHVEDLLNFMHTFHK